MVNGSKYACLLISAALIFAADARDLSAEDRPQTWFHLIGGNVSREGLTADLEAVKAAGIGGIHFFHGRGARWDGVQKQMQCIGPEWDGLVRFMAGECARLGLSFRMQNCPGWSMSGGPWIAPSNAMRKLAFARRDFRNGVFDAAIPIPANLRDADSDWHDVVTLAFPTPAGDTGEWLVPASVAVTGGVRKFSFASPVTVRSLELPSPSQLNHPWSYNPDTHAKFTAHTATGAVVVCSADYPQGCWQDKVPFTLACEEAVASEWTLEISAPHAFAVPFVRLSSAPRMENWEGLSGEVLRGFVSRRPPLRRPEQVVPSRSIREVAIGDRLGPGVWTVLRIGHVNTKKKNGPAPAEATGWECDKLDPRGADANFAGYIGRLISEVLPEGSLRGMIIDSWECERQSWTWRMEEYFRADNGYSVRTKLPALFGWIVDGEEQTDAFLLDWRRTIAGLICRNYYGRMAELAHSHGMDISWETALGDVVPGDLLAHWKDCDVPMCEFWNPPTPDSGHVGHLNFKPVKPCVSAAHLYGKKRIAAEAFTSLKLTWNENLRELKEAAVRYLARGITHFVFHTFTHNPHTDGRVPGTSFGSFIGTPFVRGQTWWSFMPEFTGWLTECGRFLERGHPVVDVLRYLGDDVGHKPDELEPFPAGYLSDYLNQDVLLNRLSVKDGCFVLPDGLQYSRIWIPQGTVLSRRTVERLESLAAQGGVIIRGDASAAVKGLPPQVAAEDGAPLTGAATRDLLWYHRREGDKDLYFFAAETNGFKGTVSVRVANGRSRISLDLAPSESVCLTIDDNGLCGLPPSAPRGKKIDLSTGWTLAFPSGWDAPLSLPIERLCAWKDLNGVSDEGRSFSGTASYTRNVDIPGESVVRAVLDLGEVRDAARVFVNGKEVAALWSRPYRCDVTPHLKNGCNALRVDVTSPWHNRLAYDANLPEDKRKTWTVWNVGPRTPPCLKAGATLATSGLLGPVKLILEHKGDNAKCDH